MRHAKLQWTATIAILLGATALTEAQTFLFEAPELVVSALEGQVATVELRFSIEELGPPEGARGIRISVVHDPAEFEVGSVEMTAELIAFVGRHPAFFSPEIMPGAWNAVLIFSAVSSMPLPFPETIEIISAEYQSLGVVDAVRTTLLEFEPSGNPLVGNQIANFAQVWLAADVDHGSLTLMPDPGFSRGDCNGDGIIGLPDDLTLLQYLFTGGATPGCLSACDFNGDDALTLPDAVFILFYMFLGGQAPPPPFMECGITSDSLGCASFASCP